MAREGNYHTTFSTERFRIFHLIVLVSIYFELLSLTLFTAIPN